MMQLKVGKNWIFADWSDSYYFATCLVGEYIDGIFVITNSVTSRSVQDVKEFIKSY
jgi:hypothetical protein